MLEKSTGSIATALSDYNPGSQLSQTESQELHRSVGFSSDGPLGGLLPLPAGHGQERSSTNRSFMAPESATSRVMGPAYGLQSMPASTRGADMESVLPVRPTWNEHDHQHALGMGRSSSSPNLLATDKAEAEAFEEAFAELLSEKENHAEFMEYCLLPDKKDHHSNQTVQPGHHKMLAPIDEESGEDTSLDEDCERQFIAHYNFQESKSVHAPDTDNNEFTSYFKTGQFKIAHYNFQESKSVDAPDTDNNEFTTYFKTGQLKISNYKEQPGVPGNRKNPAPSKETRLHSPLNGKNPEENSNKYHNNLAKIRVLSAASLRTDGKPGNRNASITDPGHKIDFKAEKDKLAKSKEKITALLKKVTLRNATVLKKQ